MRLFVKKLTMFIKMNLNACFYLVVLNKTGSFAHKKTKYGNHKRNIFLSPRAVIRLSRKIIRSMPECFQSSRE